MGEATASEEGSAPPSGEDAGILAALRAGDELAFTELVERYNSSLTRLARIYVHDTAVAEEVVQDAWIGFLKSLSRFEGRSSLKTWLFKIAINCARARARKEAHSIPFSAAFKVEDAEAVAPKLGRFFPDWVPVLGGHWIGLVSAWDDEPEQRALASETRTAIERAIGALPPTQREVITLRDVAGFGAGEVCNVLGITDTNQRVILHRARSAVRTALQRHLSREGR
jgi:RNA polymerase sigma-70 factor (ECF subfamily)